MLSPRWAAYHRELAARATEWRTFLEASPQPAPGSWPATWLRPKGNISRGGLLLLLAIGMLPLLSMIARISAWPGVLEPGLGGSWLPSIGHELNQMLSLRNISPDDRDYVLYVLFVPIGAVLIALARLTFGVRVIGFRAILISVGFQQSGFVPSLLLIAVMAVVVVTIRPVLVRLRLSYYSRVAVIMCVSVLLLIGALLVAPWVRSDTLWNVAFFPVIVLGLLAEGIAKSVDRESGATALWRTAMTILIALLLAGLSRLPFLREIAIEFPELVLTQIVLIILIAEFLDLRLLQDWDAKLSGVVPPRLFSRGSELRIAVVRTRHRGGIIARLGAPTHGGYQRRSVRRIADCLRASGHSVEVVEGDMGMLARLRDFIPPHLLSGQPGGLVFNLAHGIQGNVAVAHVPAMLEMAGLAYTGSTPLGHICAQDSVVARTLLRAAGIVTPDFRVLTEPSIAGMDPPYPVVVRPRTASGRKPRVARNRQQLLEAVALVAREGQASLVEPVFAGRDIEVAILGNAPAQCLPLVETLPGRGGRACPAALDVQLATATRAAALAAFGVCACRDFAVISLRITPDGRPVVLGIETVEVLHEGGAFELAAKAAGLTFADLVDRIVAIARERYRPTSPAATANRTDLPVPEPGARNGGRLVAG